MSIKSIGAVRLCPRNNPSLLPLKVPNPLRIRSSSSYALRDECGKLHGDHQVDGPIAPPTSAAVKPSDSNLSHTRRTRLDRKETAQDFRPRLKELRIPSKPTGMTEAVSKRRTTYPPRSVFAPQGWLKNPRQGIPAPNNRYHRRFAVQSPGGLGKYWAYVQKQWQILYPSVSWPKDGDFETARAALEQERRTAVRYLRARRTSKMSLEERKKRFVTLLIGGLLDSPSTSLTLMSKMSSLLSFRWKIHCDCLLYLRHFHLEEIEKNPYTKAEFERQVKLVSNPKYWSNFGMSQACMFLFLSHTSPEICERIIQSVFERYTPVPFHLLEVIMDYHIEQKDPDRAIELLSLFSRDDIQSDFEAKFENRMRKLIRMDSITQSETGMNFELLPKLIHLGIPMTDALHNEIIERAVALDLTDVAWELFRYMQSNGMVVDPRRHLILLRSSFQSGELDDINAIMTCIYRSEDLYKDPFLVSYTMKIVGFVCTWQRNLSAESSFAHILAIYDRAYDRAPLVQLGLADPLPQSWVASALPMPTAVQLGFTLWAYVLVQRDWATVDQLWRIFMKYVKSGDLFWRELAKHPVLYDAFAIYYGRHAELLPKAAMVLETMHELGWCKPTVRTYHVLICGYLSHGQEAAARALVQTMKERDVKTSADKWDHVMNQHRGTLFEAQMKAFLNGIQLPECLEEPENLSERMGIGDSGPTLSRAWDRVALVKAPLWDKKTAELRQGPTSRHIELPSDDN